MTGQTQAGEAANQVNVADLLKAASQAPAGVALQEYNPMESLPTLAVGEEITAGTVIVGKFVGTETIASRKFKFSQKKNAEGIPTQDRHILELADGRRLGVWTCGELGMVFGKIQPGSWIELKYNGKGMNSNNQQQHFFEYKLAQAAH